MSNQQATINTLNKTGSCVSYQHLANENEHNQKQILCISILTIPFITLLVQDFSLNKKRQMIH